MIKRLFLNGIYMGGDDIAVSISIEFPLLMPAYPAETEFAFGNLAVVVAEKTMKDPFFIFFIKHCFFLHVPLPDFFRFAETFSEMYLIPSRGSGQASALDKKLL